VGIMSDRALAFVSIIFGHTGRRGRPHKFSLSSNLGRGWVVEAVRATLGSFGSDSSKSNKFGPDIPYTVPFRFFEGAKKSDTRVAMFTWENPIWPPVISASSSF